jgi:hypothetical protein
VSQLNESQKPANPAATEGASGPPHFAPLGSVLNVLLVWPRFPSSFWSMDGILDLVPIKTDQPPLCLLTVGALCPKTWTLRLIDRSGDPGSLDTPPRFPLLLSESLLEVPVSTSSPLALRASEA